ncbi:MAG: Gx transporter family protein [Nitrospinaceae bacterium]|jgi:heptaprenyl diphosphate synthase|nr:MAG: Gx transporter family protein [Nitrospinaceae bacterium]
MGLLVALGVILHRAEALLPLPSPWIKLGLANIITLLALVFLGFREACVVTALRILLGSVLAGTFLGPTFFLSLAGGAAAVGAMVIFYQGACGPLSLVGVSVVSALAHTLAVFFLVHAFLIPQEAFLTLLPFFFSLALLSGILNGMVANHLARRLLREGLRLK